MTKDATALTTSHDIESRAESAPTGQSALTVIEALPPVIQDPQQYEAVTETGRGFRDLTREIVTFFKDIKDDAHALHRKVCAKEKLALSEPRRGLTLVKGLLDDYDERQRLAREESERIAREERERAEREAREEAERLEKAAQEERDKAERLETAARLARKDAEKLAAEPPGDPDEERDRQATIDAAESDERDRLAEVAAAKVKADDLERAAERARDAPRPETSFAAPVAEAPVVAGASKSEGWDFEIVDPAKIRVKVVRDAMRVATEEKLKSSWLGQYLRKLVTKHGEAVGEIVGEGALKLKRKTTRSYR